MFTRYVHFFFFSFSASVNGSVCVSYLAGGQQVYVGMQLRDTSRESNSGSVPGTSSAQSSARCHDWLDLLWQTTADCIPHSHMCCFMVMLPDSAYQLPWCTPQTCCPSISHRLSPTTSLFLHSDVTPLNMCYTDGSPSPAARLSPQTSEKNPETWKTRRFPLMIHCFFVSHGSVVVT